MWTDELVDGIYLEVENFLAFDVHKQNGPRIRGLKVDAINSALPQSLSQVNQRCI